MTDDHRGRGAKYVARLPRKRAARFLIDLSAAGRACGPIVWREACPCSGMMNTRMLVSIGVILAAAFAGCENPTHTQRDAATGAAAGAVIGGIIGNNSGDTASGAAIGAAAGGALGAAHGSGKDARERRREEYREEDYRDLLTDEEVDILQARARASGQSSYRLTDFLTAREKENLRRRDEVQNREIGR